jgi:hypothetical protein
MPGWVASAEFASAVAEVFADPNDIQSPRLIHVLTYKSVVYTRDGVGPFKRLQLSAKSPTRYHVHRWKDTANVVY